jgi:hypothetical protein
MLKKLRVHALSRAALAPSQNRQPGDETSYFKMHEFASLLQQSV